MEVVASDSSLGVVSGLDFADLFAILSMSHMAPIMGDFTSK